MVKQLNINTANAGAAVNTNSVCKYSYLIFEILFTFLYFILFALIFFEHFKPIVRVTVKICILKVPKKNPARDRHIFTDFLITILFLFCDEKYKKSISQNFLKCKVFGRDDTNSLL